jgi:cytochrome c oxidase assembly protein subunit 15
MDPILHRYRKLVFLTWFLTLDLVMFGAFVRLTDSGLGCPDWPGCYGNVTPFGAQTEIQQAHRVMPFGPVSMSKAWIEMIHRYVGALLGMLMMAIVYMAWRYRVLLKQTPAVAMATLGVVCVQGAFGAWTVTQVLMPAIVTAHLLLGMLTLAMMTWLAAREKPHAALRPEAARWRGWMVGGMLLLSVQIALGGWVSTNYAALACLDFPLCGGQWLPPMNVVEGFSLMRHVGEHSPGVMISQYALTAIHWVHRNFALLVLFYLGILGWRMRLEPGLRRPATVLLVLLGIQCGTGLAIIFLEWPLIIAVLHNGVAAGLILVCVTLLLRLSPPRGDRGARDDGFSQTRST